MNEYIKFPIRFDSDFTIVDADGIVLCPCITYRGNGEHLVKQKMVGDYIVSCLNNQNGYYLDGNEWKKLEDISLHGVVSSINSNGDKKIKRR